MTLIPQTLKGLRIALLLLIVALIPGLCAWSFLNDQGGLSKVLVLEGALLVALLWALLWLIPLRSLNRKNVVITGVLGGLLSAFLVGCAAYPLIADLGGNMFESGIGTAIQLGIPVSIFGLALSFFFSFLTRILRGNTQQSQERLV